MRTLILVLSCCSIGYVPGYCADAKPAPSAQGENDVVELQGTAYADKDSIRALLGVDPGMDLIVVDVSLRVKGEGEAQVWLDDFVLISRKDGQRCKPMTPSQLAGKGTVFVTSKGAASGGFGSGGNPNRRPIWGGVPGTGTRPQRVGGDDQGSVVGTAPAETKAKVGSDANNNEPLLDVLTKNVLAESTTKDKVAGKLYFLLDGKHKLKDLEILYKTGNERIILDFIR